MINHRCKANRKNGQPCGAYAVSDSDFCFTHSPDRQKERGEARRKGGEHKRRIRNDAPFPACDPKTAQGLGVLMESVMHGAWSLDLQPPHARTLGYLVSVQKGVLEVGELEERVKKLEETVAAEGHK